MSAVVVETNFSGVGAPKRGKVRDVYDLGEQLLIVATDRLSAFDVVLPTPIPDKGKVLTQLSLFWFGEMKGIVKNHVIEADVTRYPERLKPYAADLEGRSMIVQKAKVIPVECVVRGYLSGSGWSEYGEKGSVCGIGLPAGLVESAKLPEPVFTPTTKADEGHDMAITFAEVERLIGPELARTIRDLSIRIYSDAARIGETRGIIIADTKFEFGIVNGEVIIVDEALTPDSSRFWSKADYAPGRGQDSFDKQVVRDYLNTLDWPKTYPGPELPAHVVEKTRARYVEILKILSGMGLA
jgi:phosphoribosylaminoimidazole-succinocarboxamide synthase